MTNEWNIYGIPEGWVTDRAKEFKSNHIKQVGQQLNMDLYLRAFPEAGGLIETIFNIINQEFLSGFPGYTGENTLERPPNAEKNACLTLDELEAELIRYFVDHYNYHDYPRLKSQKRAERWEQNLLAEPQICDERELDICLLKIARRKVQKYGCVQFNHLIYESSCLAKYQGQEICLRYDRRNIATLLAYSRPSNGKPSEFISAIKARYFQHEQLSLGELKWIWRKLRESEKQADNTSILNERYHNLNFIAEKRFLKRRRKKIAQRERERQTNQSKVIEIFPQNVPSDPASSSSNSPATRDFQQPSEPENCRDLTAIAPDNNSRPSRRAKRTSIDVGNWSEFKQNNW